MSPRQSKRKIVYVMVKFPNKSLIKAESWLCSGGQIGIRTSLSFHCDLLA